MSANLWTKHITYKIWNETENENDRDRESKGEWEYEPNLNECHKNWNLFKQPQKRQHAIRKLKGYIFSLDIHNKSGHFESKSKTNVVWCIVITSKCYTIQSGNW